MKTMNADRGFVLIEFLVAIFILSIVSTIAFSTLSNATTLAIKKIDRVTANEKWNKILSQLENDLRGRKLITIKETKKNTFTIGTTSGSGINEEIGEICYKRTESNELLRFAIVNDNTTEIKQLNLDSLLSTCVSEFLIKIEDEWPAKTYKTLLIRGKIGHLLKETRFWLDDRSTNL